MTDKLRVPIKDLLDASLDEARVQRMWRGLQQRPAQTATPRRWFVAGALVACALLLFVLRTPDPGPLAARGTDTLRFDRARTELSDGSQIELGPDTRLALLENNGQSFVLQLDRGRARFEVTPGGPRRWRMECGLASVTVVGTALTIERGASSLRVEVAHGIVEVRGERVPGGLRRLTAGQSLSINSRAAPSGNEQSRSTPASANAPTLSTNSAVLPAHQEPEQAGTTQPKAAASTPPLSKSSAKARAATPADTFAEPARMPQAPAEPATRPLATDGSRAATQRLEHSEDATSLPPVTTAPATRALDSGTALRRRSTTVAAPAPPTAAAPTTGATTVQAPAKKVALSDPLNGGAVDPTNPAARSSEPSHDATQVTPNAAGAPITPGPADVSRDAAQLLAEADRARLRGAQKRALAILQELLRAHPGTSEAGIAGFTLARMQMEQEPRAAVDALRASLAAATPASLREDALARLVEAYARSGEPALARSAATEYRSKYPSGRLLAEVEHWAAKP